jgi:hypothetical protein
MNDEVNKFLNRVRDDDKAEAKPAVFIGSQFKEYALGI